MNLFVGFVILFWGLIGAVFFGFVFLNVFKKAHQPLQSVPVLLVLVIGFGMTLISMFYYSTQVVELLPTLNTQTESVSKPSLSNGLFR